jgi:hypothetical protein
MSPDAIHVLFIQDCGAVAASAPALFKKPAANGAASQVGKPDGLNSGP